jgi:hypothetical protein
MRTSEDQTPLEDLGVSGKIILKWNFKKCEWDMDCIDVA